MLIEMLCYKSYTSEGLCSSIYYKYGKVASIISLLVTVSTVVLLSILVCDLNNFKVKVRKSSQ